MVRDLGAGVTPSLRTSGRSSLGARKVRMAQRVDLFTGDLRRDLVEKERS
jgi:hypothetical protein